MNHKFYLSIAVLAAVVLSLSPARADFDLEFGLNNGYTNNLLGEISSRDDSYSTTRLLAKWYPAPQLQLNIGSDYTYYSNLIGLGSVATRAGLIWIPTSADNRFSLYFESNFSARRYRSAFGAFDTNESYFKASAGFKLSPALLLRSGLKASTTNYITPDTTTDADYEQYELFAGANLTFLGNNALDIEAGFGLTNFAFIDASIDSSLSHPDNPIIQISPSEFIDAGDFRAFYISPRLSRPLGSKTGISLTYVYRQFIDTDNAVVLGFTTDFLSPWAASFEGSSVQLRIKTFIVPHCIITGGVGYWDKTYLRSIEYTTRQLELFPGYIITETRWVEPKDATARKDDMTRLYFGLQRPFSLNGAFIEPSFGLEYIDNRSTHDSYDYSTTAASFSLLIRP